jgi:hypothetical protein
MNEFDPGKEIPQGEEDKNWEDNVKRKNKTFHVTGPFCSVEVFDTGIHQL